MMEKRNIPFSPPDISEEEIEEVVKALRSGWITTGPRTKLFERRLAAFIETGRVDIDCDTEENVDKYSNKVACLGSGTAAEELNLRILGIREGDEVIVPAYTYTATAAAAIHCGAKVVFVDIQKDGDPVTHAPEMDYDKVADIITEKTKAIIAVDIAGIVCDYEKLFQIVDQKRNSFHPMDKHDNALDDLSTRIQQTMGRIAVVSDCAHGLGASRRINGEWIYTGRIADFTSFSFHAVKNLTTAEGGAATWNLPKEVYEGEYPVTDQEIYHMYQLLSLHGQSKDALSKTKAGAWEYDVIGPWYKCNMTDIAAAIGLRQLDRYPNLLKRRKEIVEQYDKCCNEIGVFHLNHITDNVMSSMHLYLTRIPGIDEEQRNELIEQLAEEGVATNVHYKPLPMMTAYKELGTSINCFPNAYNYYKKLLTLPLQTYLTDEDLQFVCICFNRIIVKVEK